MLLVSAFAAFMAAPTVIPDALPAGAAVRLGSSRYLTRGTIRHLAPAGDLVVGASAADGPVAWDAAGRTQLRSGCTPTSTFFCRTTLNSTLGVERDAVLFADEGSIDRYRLPTLHMLPRKAGYYMECVREWFSDGRFHCLRQSDDGAVDLKSVDVRTGKETTGPFRGFHLGRGRFLALDDPELDMDGGRLLDGKGRVVRQLGTARHWIFEPGSPGLAAARAGKDRLWQHIDILDPRTGKRIARHPAPAGVEYGRAAIGASGRVAIGFSRKGSIRVAVVPADFPPVELPGKNVFSVAVTPSGAVWVSVDHRLHHIDPTGKRVDARPRLGMGVEQIRFTAQGVLTAAGDGIIHWGLDGTPRWAHQHPAGLVALSPNWVLTGNQLIRVSDGRVGRSPCLENRLSNGARLTYLAFDPADALICPTDVDFDAVRFVARDPRTGAEHGPAVAGDDEATHASATHLWQKQFRGLVAIDRATGRSTQPISIGAWHLAHDGQAYILDHEGLARVTVRGDALVRQPLVRRRFIRKPKTWGLDITVNAFAVRPGQPHAVLGWSDGRVEVVHLQTGETLFASAPVSPEIAAVATSPDGAWFATGGRFGQSYLWRFDDVLAAR